MYSTYLGGSVATTGPMPLLDRQQRCGVRNGFLGISRYLGHHVADHSGFGQWSGHRRLRAKFTFNQAPTATTNSYTVAEGGTLNGNVITDNTGAGVDSDPDGDPLTASLVEGPLHGTLALERRRLLHLHAVRCHRRHQLCRQRQLHLPGQRRQGRHRHRHGQHHGHARCDQRGAGQQRAGRAERRSGQPLVFSEANGNRILLRDDAGGNVIEVTLTATNGTVTLAGTTGLTITGGANGSAHASPSRAR